MSFTCLFVRLLLFIYYALLGFLLLHDFIAFIDPAIDRRTIYNDFRSNPYLHFDAGLVPRALGVQLDEFHLFICLFIVVHLPYFIHALSFDSVDRLYVSILLLLSVITRWVTVTITYVRNYINLNFWKSIRSNQMLFIKLFSFQRSFCHVK